MRRAGGHPRGLLIGLTNRHPQARTPQNFRTPVSYRANRKETTKKSRCLLSHRLVQLFNLRRDRRGIGLFVRVLLRIQLGQ